MVSKLTVRQFFARFRDDEAYLTHVMEVRYGRRHVCRKCGRGSHVPSYVRPPALACAQCGDHVYPTAGTIFQDTRAPLQS